MNEEGKGFLMVCGVVGGALGALTGWGLSFTTLSPLVIGGIVGSTVIALLTAYSVGDLLCRFYRKDPIEKKDVKNTFFFIIATLASVAIGVGFAATAIFPNGMLGTALTGATIGVIAPIAGLIAALAIVLATEKVNEHIISPIVNKVSECFSSKEQGVKAN